MAMRTRCHLPRVWVPRTRGLLGGYCDGSYFCGGLGLRSGVRLVLDPLTPPSALLYYKYYYPSIES